MAHPKSAIQTKLNEARMAFKGKTDRYNHKLTTLRLWKKKNKRVGSLKMREIQKFRADALAQADTLAPVKMKFAGSYGLV